MGDRLNLERQRQKNKVKAVLVIEQKTSRLGSVLSDSTGLMQIIQLYTAQHSNALPIVTPFIPTYPPPTLQIRNTSNGTHTHAADTMTCEKAEKRGGTNVVQNIMASTVSKNKYCATVDARETRVMDLTASDDDDDNNGVEVDVEVEVGGGDDGWVRADRDGSKECMNMMASNEKVSSLKSESISIRVTAKERGKEKESPMSEETSLWTCSTCTCLNPSLVKFCEACLQPYSKNKTNASTSTCMSAVKGKGKRRLSVKDGNSDGLSVKSETDAEGDTCAHSSKLLKKRMKTLEQITLLPNVDNNSGMIQCLYNDSEREKEKEKEKESYCFITHDRTIKSDGNMSKRGLMNLIGEGEHHSRDRDRDGSQESVFAFQLPEPLPLLPLTIDPQATFVSSQITASDSFLHVDSDDMLSASDVNHKQGNALSLRLSESTSSISEKFFSFGYEYPSERIDLSDLTLLKLTGPDSIVRARMPGTDSLYGLSSSSEKHRTCDYDEEARTPDDDDQFHWIWDPDSCVVFGKRYGDPKRKGKSKFCGMTAKAAVHLIIHQTSLYFSSSTLS